MKPQSQQRAVPAEPVTGASPIPGGQSPVTSALESAATEDFFAVRQDRIRDEARPSEPQQWRHVRERDFDYPEEVEEKSSRPDLRLVEPVAKPKSKPLSKDEQKRFKRLVTPLQPFHFGLFIATFLLTILSIPLVYSASGPIAMDQHKNDPNFFLVRQAAYVAIGLAIMIGVSRISPEKLRIGMRVLFVVAVVGLLLTKFSPLGYSMGNTKRWVKLGPITIQFSELAKIALIGAMAEFWSWAAKERERSWSHWGIAAGITMVPVGLVMLQPHLSAALVLVLIPVAIAFFSGVPVKQIGTLAAAAAIFGVFTLGLCKSGHMPFIRDYQAKRIKSWLDGDKDPKAARDHNYQANMAKAAVAHGGLLGTGPGGSFFKHTYLPAPHTDYIFAITAEEWGLAGSLCLLILFGLVVYFCFSVAHTTRNHFEQLLCTGVGALIGFQVVANIAVVSGIFPVTGIPLPIITFGGSSLWCFLGALGLVLAVSRSLNDPEEEFDMDVEPQPQAKPARVLAPVTA